MENNLDIALANTIGDSTPETQAALYKELQKWNLTKTLERGSDYFLVDTIEQVKYYSPNDEEWGAIIAVSEHFELAVYTGFYEMDDMEQPKSGYNFVVSDGELKCKWETE